MAERVFCVDFGSAFTKVALRAAPEKPAESVLIGFEFCVPTVVSAVWKTGKPKPELSFGEVAADRTAGAFESGRVAVYADFKRHLFATPVSDAPAIHPLDALLHSQEFEELAAKHGVQTASVAGLRRLVDNARLMLGVQEATGQAASRKQDEAKTVTHHYFKWLHEQVMAACETLPHMALNYQDIPLRIAVPVFGSSSDLDKHPGCVRIREALNATGWKCDGRLFVSEPESNAIGVLTKATNILQKTGRAHLGQMFSKGPMITVVKGDKHHQTYRALVIDIGAYTTDFASLLIKTDGRFVETTETGWFGITQMSVPIGVFNLDASVLTALPDDKRNALNSLARKDFAAFQISAYTDETGYRIGPGKVIGGPADRPVIENCLTAFCKRLTDETAAFIQQLGPASMQELILTGGGNNIPVVRDSLIKAAAAAPGSPFVKTHAPGLKKSKVSPLVDPLDDKFARGGSALGGASIFFDKSYN